MAGASTSASTLPRTYRASGSWTIFLYVCAILCAGGGIASIWYARSGDFADLGGRITMACMGVVFFLLGTFVFLWLVRAKVILEPGSISFQGIFITKTFRPDELRGWRIMRNTSPPLLVLERKQGRAFRTSLVFRPDDALQEWLNTIPALDVQVAATSLSQVENDERLGLTPTERAENLQAARSRAKTLYIVSLAAGLWALFYPKPYPLCMLALIVLPWFGIEMMRRSSGVFRADEVKNDAHPNVAYALVFPPLMLGLRAIIDCNIIQSATAFALYLLVGGLFLFAIFTFDPTQRRAKFWNIVGFVFIGLVYGYGTVAQADTLLDHSPGVAYSATVESKSISSGRTTTYELRLSAWGPKPDNNELDVTSATYDEIQVGDTVSLKLQKGALSLPWYFLDTWTPGPNHVDTK